MIDVATTKKKKNNHKRDVELVASSNLTNSAFPSRSTTQSRKRRLGSQPTIIDMLIEKRADNQQQMISGQQYRGEIPDINISMNEVLGGQSITADYTTPIRQNDQDEEEDSLVVINALQGLTPKQTS